MKRGFYTVYREATQHFDQRALAIGSRMLQKGMACHRDQLASFFSSRPGLRCSGG